MRAKKAFTLIELLVVIGIIGILLGILLPAMQKAKDQANTTACQAVMRQFYNLETLYVSDFHGYVIPASEQIYDPTVSTNSTEIDWYEWPLLGVEVNQNLKITQAVNGFTSYHGSQGVLANEVDIKRALVCPAANHGSDPSFNDPTANGYFGDYVYNCFMGITKNGGVAGQTYITYPQPHMTQIPNNVVILLESYKPNYDTTKTNNTPTGYKDYFGNSNGGGWTDSLNDANNGVNRIGTPHHKGTMCNILCADGHIYLTNPYIDPAIVENLPGGIYPTPMANPPTTTGNLQNPYKYNSTPVFADYMIGPGPGTPGKAQWSAATGPLNLSAGFLVPKWNKNLPELP